RTIFAALVRKADVVVENFSSGVTDRLGIGYGFARAVNPRIVYCSITGVGKDGSGKASSKKAMDRMIQALNGVMDASGNEGEPPVRLGVRFGDLCAPMVAVIGVLAAVHQARRTGVGQHVDISMVGALTALVAAEPFDALELCGAATRTGMTMPRLA